MAFQGYTQQTVDFMWGIRFNNERGWFLEHKDDYINTFLTPTRELGEQVYDAVHALLPDEPRPWVLHVFLDRHECFAQYYGYTFRKRFGWPAPAAWAAAGVLSLTVPAVVRSFGAIPVYRSLKETRDMMEQSAQALLRGESIMLCPDVAYDSAAPATLGVL